MNRSSKYEPCRRFHLHNGRRQRSISGAVEPARKQTAHRGIEVKLVNVFKVSKQYRHKNIQRFQKRLLKDTKVVTDHLSTHATDRTISN